MSMEGHRFYPGERASAAQILLLANEYRRSADSLLNGGRSGCVISWAPYRLVAIHAIELYLNAYLVAAGCRAGEIRAMQHDTAARAQFAAVANLQLRKRTSAHLQALSDHREYLVARYDPAPATVSQLNRLQATLTEVAQKVACAVANKVASTPPESEHRVGFAPQWRTYDACRVDPKNSRSPRLLATASHSLF